MSYALPSDQALEATRALQTLLDDCHTNGTTPDSCHCADFQSEGHCAHVAILFRFKGLYKTVTVDVGYNGPGSRAHHVVTATRYLADATAIAARKVQAQKVTIPAAQPVPAYSLKASEAELARIAQAAIHPENWTPVVSVKPARPFLAGLRAAFGAPMSLQPVRVGVSHVG